MATVNNEDAVDGRLTITGTEEPTSSVPEGYTTLTVNPKIYLNGFPKSGLHLAALMTLCLVEEEAYKWPWAGTFKWNSWTNDWSHDWQIYQRLARLREGAYLKAHAGYREDVERFLFQIGAQVAFIYRDLRDVAISQSFHVINESEDAMHPDKELYRALPTQEERIIACINGIDKYPGIIDRWELYAPWLDVEWVHKMQYEDMRLNPFTTSQKFTRYVYERMAYVNGIKLEMSPEKINAQACRMVMLMEQRDVSPTYRRGIPGEWAQHWTDKIDKAFTEVGGHDWNRKLGYEE